MADKVLVDAAWLLAGPEHVEWCRQHVAGLRETAPREARQLERLWASTMDGWIELDRCIADEVLWLNGEGVRTFTCCCGHTNGYTFNRWIAVDEGDTDAAARMAALGYEPRWIRLAGAKPEAFVFLPRWAA